MLPLELRGITSPSAADIASADNIQKRVVLGIIPGLRTHIKDLKMSALFAVTGAFELLAVACGSPARGESIEPTSTSTATATPEPTFTSTATETPEPTATETPEPTATETPEPTSTPKPPKPTSTRVPPPSTPISPPEPNPEPTPPPPTRSEIFMRLEPEKSAKVAELINLERQNRGLHVLTTNPLLIAAAEGYVTFLHNSAWLDQPGVDREKIMGTPIQDPHTRRGTPQSRAQEAGYRGEVGEVIGYHRILNRADWERAESWPADIVKGWQDSQAHWDALMNSHWREIGVSCILEMQYNRPIYNIAIPAFLCVANVGKS